MASPIIAKETLAVNDVGPNGIASLIYIQEANQLLIINDGPDPINYFINDGVKAFNADSFFIPMGEFCIDTIRNLQHFFVICDTGGTASVRYKAVELPTIRGHF